MGEPIRSKGRRRSKRRPAPHPVVESNNRAAKRAAFSAEPATPNVRVGTERDAWRRKRGLT